MNKKSIVFLALTGLVLSASFYVKQVNNNKEDNVPVSAETKSYTIQDFCNYLENKREHYPLSDEFIERYQQSSGGYIDYARQCGIVVDKTLHSPNQKWHFFSSWLEYGEIDKTGDAKSRIYVGLKCPELLLWIYEAMGVDPVKVNNAKIVAEQGRISGTNVSTLAKNMRAEVTWEDLIVNLE